MTREARALCRSLLGLLHPSRGNLAVPAPQGPRVDSEWPSASGLAGLNADANQKSDVQAAYAPKPDSPAGLGCRAPAYGTLRPRVKGSRWRAHRSVCSDHHEPVASLAPATVVKR